MNSSPSFDGRRAAAEQPLADLSTAPLPTEKTLKMRKSVPRQAVRYAVFNLRMLKILVKGD